MSEKDFWTKFFQSYYFRRDQITTSANDLFADCSLKDDEDLRNKAQKFLDDPYSVIETNRDLTSEDVTFFFEHRHFFFKALLSYLNWKRDLASPIFLRPKRQIFRIKTL